VWYYRVVGVRKAGRDGRTEKRGSE